MSCSPECLVLPFQAFPWLKQHQLGLYPRPQAEVRAPEEMSGDEGVTGAANTGEGGACFEKMGEGLGVSCDSPFQEEGRAQAHERHSLHSAADFAPREKESLVQHCQEKPTEWRCIT